MTRPSIPAMPLSEVVEFYREHNRLVRESLSASPSDRAQIRKDIERLQKRRHERVAQYHRERMGK